VGGNAEIVRDDATGRLVHPADAPALARALLGLLHESQRASSFGRAARQWVEKHGSLEAMATRYGKLYFGDMEAAS